MLKFLKEIRSFKRFPIPSFRRSFCQGCSTATQSPQQCESRLWAIYRDPKQCLALRKAGMIPGIISDYDLQTGMNHNKLIALKRQEIWGLMTTIGKKDFMSRFYVLEIHEGLESEDVTTTLRVFPRKLYLLNGRREILNLAFVRVRRNVKLRMYIPLKFRGRTISPGLIEGGNLLVLKKGVSCYCLPDKVPPYIEVNVSKLKVGERILLNDLNLDLQYRRQASHVVCEIVKRFKTVKRKHPELLNLDSQT